MAFITIDFVSISIPNPQNPEKPKNLSSIIYVFLRDGRGGNGYWIFINIIIGYFVFIWLLGLINYELQVMGSCLYVCMSCCFGSTLWFWWVYKKKPLANGLHNEAKG